MSGKSIQSYLLAGLVVWLPIVITFVVLKFLVDLLDNTMALLPQAYRPEQLFGMHIPGLGVIISLMVLLLTGIAVTNFLGQRIVKWSESILDKIPLVRSLYNGTKQVINALLSNDSMSFKKVLLVEWPRKGMWSVAFHTGSPGKSICAKEQTKEMLSVFIPTTPNPTSGFLMVLPKDDTIELNMTIDEALKYIISLGVMQPSKTDLTNKVVTPKQGK